MFTSLRRPGGATGADVTWTGPGRSLPTLICWNDRGPSTTLHFVTPHSGIPASFYAWFLACVKGLEGHRRSEEARYAIMAH